MQGNNHSIDFLLKLNILDENIDDELDEDWVETRLDALIEDIANIEGVVGATSSKLEQIISITIKSDLSENELKEIMKIYLLRDQEYFRVISIEIIN